jgi:hypothetical protein
MNRALLLPAMLLAACVGDPEPAGEATATITQVPLGVGCIQIQVVGSRSVVKNVDVMTGMNSTVSLPGLPVGSDTFSAVAFGAGCSAISGAAPNWASDPVLATVAAGGVTPVTLAMHAVGGASVGVDFPGSGGTTDGGAPDLGGVSQALLPSTLSFGSVTVMVSSAPQTVTLYNNSPMPMTITDVGSLAGVNSGDWFTPSNTCTMLTLAPGATCQVQIGFRPTGTGARSGTFKLTTPLGSLSVSMSGTGI